MITFGRPDTFAIRITPLGGGPQDGDRSAQATWVGFELWVAGWNLTDHTHLESGERHPGLHWPAIYFARWFVRSWQGLFETARWPRPARTGFARNVAEFMRAWDARLAERPDAPEPELAERDQFVAHHAFEAAAGGGVVPRVFFAREGDQVNVVWESPEESPVAFHRPRGERDVPARSFFETVRRFVDWTAGQLEGEDNPLCERDRAELAAWLEYVKGPRAAENLLIHYAGIPYERGQDLARAAGAPDLLGFFGLGSSWSAAGAAVDPTTSMIAVAFRCASPRLDAGDLLHIRKVLLGVAPNATASAALGRLAQQVPSSVGVAPDYEQGYELAARVRAVVGNPLEYLDIEALLDHLGCPVLSVDLSDPEIDGGAVCDDTHGPAVLVNERSPQASSPWGRRMVLAHELCHLLFDRRSAVPLAILSGPWAPSRIERRANAFAAELLLPLDGILAEVGEERQVTDEILERLMNKYGVGLKTCSWHLENRLK